MMERGRALIAITIGVFAFMFVPIAVVIVYSFNSKDSIAAFGSPSLRWYRSLLANDALLASLWTSLRIAAVVTVVAVVIGFLLSLGLVRLRQRESALPQTLITLTFITPEIATAAALLVLFSTVGVTLSTTTVVVSHVSFCIAYVVLVTRTRLATLNREVEEAATDLGASQLQTIWLVILPQMWPAIGASACLVFLLSFDDFVTSLFTSGVGTSPLPVRIYSMLRHGITPEINALGTLMTVITLTIGLGAAAAVVLRGRRSVSRH